MTALQMLQARWAEGKLLCVGLDSDHAKVPHPLPGGRHRSPMLGERCYYDNPAFKQLPFNQAVVDATKDLVAAYKPNLAFYLELGIDGLAVLDSTIRHIRQVAPTVPIILDAKWADIGNTNLGYARYAFQELKVDGVTLNPYLGYEALRPFLVDHPDKFFFILARTSNEGAPEFQGLRDVVTGQSLSSTVARRVHDLWNTNRNCGLVAGATSPRDITAIRRLAPDLPLLIPGIGKQGGVLEDTLAAGLDSRRSGILVNSSRDIIFASDDPEKCASAARAAAQQLDQKMRAIVSNFTPSSESKPPVPKVDVLDLLISTEALLTGHFVYTSGRHGPKYVNKDLIYSCPGAQDILDRLLFEQALDFHFDVIVAPAIGAVALGSHLANLCLHSQRPVRFAYADKDGDGFIIKRGFDKFVRGSRVLIVEDIVNSGKTVRGVINATRTLGGEVVAVLALCNRGGVTTEALDVPEFRALLNLEFNSWSEQECQLCREGVPVSTDVGHGQKFLESKQGASRLTV